LLVVKANIVALLHGDLVVDSELNGGNWLFVGQIEEQAILGLIVDDVVENG
jgi:hypothetical protein